MADSPEAPDLTEAEAAQNGRDGYALAVATKRIETLEADNFLLRRRLAAWEAFYLALRP